MNFTKLLFGILTIFALQILAQVDLEKGLVAYYPFSGNTADSSGNGHDGINHGATLTVDRYGQPNSAYYFNGSDTCMIEIPDHPDFNFHDSLTFVLWYRYDNNNKNSRSTLFNKGGADTSAFWGFRRYGFGELIFYNYPDEHWGAWVGQQYQNLEDGNWHWIAIRFRSKAHDAFVDGELSTGGSSAFEKFLASNDSSLTIGNVLGLSDRGWAGEIDELRFYNRYLSNTEISRLYSDPTSVEDDEKLGTEFKLFQNYPNPFNPTTRIEYQVTRQEMVTLRVFNALGQLITTLVNESKPPGSYKVTFDASNLPSGVYFYRLATGNYSESKKMTLIR